MHTPTQANQNRPESFVSCAPEREDEARAEHPRPGPLFDHPAEYVTDAQLAALWKVSRQTVWRWARTGRIPKPVKLGPNCTRWHFAKTLAALEGGAA